MCSGLSYRDAILKIENSNIKIRRRSWDPGFELSLIIDYDVKIKCEHNMTGDRHRLDNDDFNATDWEVICAS